MIELRNKVIWLTGASSGIGEALAYQLSEAGATLILSARREGELKRVRGACSHPEQVYVVPLDLMNMEGIEALVSDWVKKLGTVDILVNNGGISMRATVAEASMEVHRRLMEVNFFGQIALARAVLPHMLASGFGQMVVVSSLTGKFGFPLRSSYAASKHALHGFFETLHLECMDRGVQVSMINPGRIATEISLHALNPDGSAQGSMDPSLAKGMSAEECARQIVKSLCSRRYETTIGSFGQRFLVRLKGISAGLFHRIAKQVPAK